MAVCSFCRSTLARDGDALRRIGQSAELFDDHTPLQLGASGRWQGVGFTLVGRLQMRYAEGSWNEWHALFDGGDGSAKVAWLSEDNGRYVMAFDAPAPPQVPRIDDLRPGLAFVIDGRSWQVASVVRASIAAAQGELPFVPPPPQREFTIVDLRNAQDEVATLSFAEPAKPQWSIGRAAALSELALAGLRDASEKSLGARGLQCPNCGAALELNPRGSVAAPERTMRSDRIAYASHEKSSACTPFNCPWPLCVSKPVSCIPATRVPFVLLPVLSRSDSAHTLTDWKKSKDVVEKAA